MKFDKKVRRIAVAAGVISVLAIGAVANAGPPSGKGGGKKPPVTTTTTTTAPTPPAPTYNDVDSEFVAMMIPHHFQATVMSELAPGRSTDESLLALADRIDVEQDLEIGMMQNWQTWNDLDITDAEMSYQMMLGMPMMIEQMGMATADELDDLADASGTDFDRLYLELMIDHHEGALTMLENVMISGSDTTLEFWANDMLTAQAVQVFQMEEMLADLS